MPDLKSTLEVLFRQESGRILAGLIRMSRSWELAEEALQEAFAVALVRWNESGLPHNPAAWITTTAQRKLIDDARKRQRQRAYDEQLRHEGGSTTSTEEAVQFPCKDERLSLIFTCCHPALSKEAQIALTLRTLGGLTTSEIARAFLVNEPSLAQRIVRAKRKIQEARIPYEIPSANALPDRLFSVRAVLYLIFNEGYSASQGDSLIRRELCAEAIRLARTLCELMPDVPENLGLLALMLLHDSRRETRTDGKGDLVLLEEQDRTLWDHAQIGEGVAYLERALRMRQPGSYQLQAAIAALHARAKTPAETDWPQIAALYRELAARQPSATVALNHAVAVAMSEGASKGLQLLDCANANGALDSYHLYHAARADLLRREARREEACEAYRKALELTGNAVEQRYLQYRLTSLCKEL